MAASGKFYPEFLKNLANAAPFEIEVPALLLLQTRLDKPVDHCPKFPYLNAQKRCATR